LSAGKLTSFSNLHDFGNSHKQEKKPMGLAIRLLTPFFTEER